MGKGKKGTDYNTEASIVVIGSRLSGKSCLIEKFTQGLYSDHYTGTVGVDCNSRVLEVDDKLVRLRLWDTSGQQAFMWTAEKHLREADGIIFVYDITDIDGFRELPSWLELVNRCAKSRDLPKVLVGTKTDLRHKQVVTESQAKEFGIPEGMQHFEVSAKAGKNVSVVFYVIAKEILQWRQLGCVKKLGQPSPMQLYGEPNVIEMVEKIEEDEPEYHHLFKILLLGASRVGKTAARFRFCRGYYSSDYHRTSGLEYSTRTVRINREIVKLQIWDVGGDPVFDATRKSYYRGATGFIIMYDVGNQKSFEKAEMYIKELDMYEQPDSPKIVIANKCDLAEAKQQVNQDAAKSWADGWRLPLVEASARTGDNIDSAFLKLAAALRRQLAPWKRLYNFE